jgi:AcrR family transcriptional regulator
MPKTRKPDRSRQRLRTRKDLILAAGRILKRGRKPTLEEVAEEALVSRATAYRYFPSVESLLVEVPVEAAVPDSQQLFADDRSVDPARRVDKAEAALHRMVYENEAQLRIMLANRLEQRTREQEKDAHPLRQNRRTPLIEAALSPARKRFTNASYRKLCAALAMVFGPESMVVFRDVLAQDETTARKVKSWAIQALVDAALRESRKVARGS